MRQYATHAMPWRSMDTGYVSIWPRRAIDNAFNMLLVLHSLCIILHDVRGNGTRDAAINA